MKLHVISFDVPWPANYGGVIDVYNRLEALHENGIEVILHAFDYGRGPAKALNKICAEVHYYKRKNRVLSMLKKDPMIVASRASSEQLKRLQEDDHPILFEGQHTTFYLDHPKLKDRKKLVRIHNVEHEYYAALSRSSNNEPRKHYYKKEAKKLKAHETILKNADQLLCISQKDTNYYQNRFGNASYLPIAIQCEKNASVEEGDSLFALYHGNLSVAENDHAAHWLLENICPKIEDQFVFAGMSPGKELKEAVAHQKNAKLIESPSTAKMNHLISTAKVHALYTDQSTGVKIKLLKALCSGAPVICNQLMVEGSGLEKACWIKNEPDEFAQTVSKCMSDDTDSQMTERKEIMDAFNYKSHADIICSFLH